MPFAFAHSLFLHVVLVYTIGVNQVAMGVGRARNWIDYKLADRKLISDTCRTP